MDSNAPNSLKWTCHAHGLLTNNDAEAASKVLQTVFQFGSARSLAAEVQAQLKEAKERETSASGKKRKAIGQPNGKRAATTSSLKARKKSSTSLPGLSSGSSASSIAGPAVAQANPTKQQFGPSIYANKDLAAKVAQACPPTLVKSPK